MTLFWLISKASAWASYRDGTNLLPIVVRAPEEERVYLEQWQDIQVYSPALNRYIPMAQVIDSMPLAWEEQNYSPP